MPDVSIFNLSGTAINVKDSTARTQAASAQSAASTAQTTANQAKTAAQTAQQAAEAAEARIDEIADLSRVEVTYADKTETITITTKTHST